jgi:cell division protein FtsZ
MGIGSARGEDRAVQAAETAISSPLLEASVDGAHGVLLSIQGGSDLGLFEINEAARLVQEAAHPEANIIFGAVIDDALGDEVRVTVIAAGFDGGTPTRRKDDRALGQVSGRPSGTPGAGLPATNGAGLGSVRSPLHAAGVPPTRPLEPQPVGGLPTAPSQRPQPLDAEPVSLHTQPTEPVIREQPLQVPPAPAPQPLPRAVDLPSEVRAGRPVRPIAIDEDLDVPDFLK